MVLGNSGRGGSQAYVMNVVRNINREKFQIDFAFCDDEEGGYGDEMRSLGCKTFIIPFFRGTNYWEYKEAWIKLLTDEKYDILHAHATGAASIYLDVAQKMGLITIAHSHSASYRGNFLVQFVKKQMAKSVRKYADYWFACSDKAAERLFGNDYHTFKNYYEIPNAINTERFLYSEEKRKKIRESLGIEDDQWLFGHIGTFSAPKNHKFLVSVFEEIHKVKPESKLLLCGEGYLMKDVKRQIQELNLQDYVVMTGNVTNVGDYMMAMDTMIFPSFFEGFPVTLIEAQATGLRVVYSDAITNEVRLTDRVIPSSLEKSAKEWAEQVLQKDCVDRKSYNQIIEKSRFNMRSSIDQLSQLYSDMIFK